MDKVDIVKDIVGVGLNSNPYTGIPSAIFSFLWKYKWYILLGIVVLSIIIYIGVLNYKISSRDKTITELGEQITQVSVEREILFNSNSSLQNTISDREKSLNSVKYQSNKNRELAKKYEEELNKIIESNKNIKTKEDFKNWLNNIYVERGFDE